MSTYQAMLSYRRTDKKFAEALRVELKKVYDIDCFRDVDDEVPGYDWQNCWLQQLHSELHPLAPGLGPTVIVLATDAMLDLKPDGVVVQENWEALTNPERENPFVVLQFGTRGWPRLKALLQEKAHSERVPDVVNKLDRFHRPDPFDVSLLRPDLTDQEWNQVCKPIVRNVRSYFLNILKKERSDTKDWAEAISKRPLVIDEFSSQRSRIQLHGDISDLALTREKKAVIAVGAGGLGKTTQVALSLHKLLAGSEELRFYPIVLSSDDVNHLDVTLRDRFRLTWLNSDRTTVSLADEGLHEFADSLCFITDSLERADNVEKTARQLERLRGVAKLIVTSRPEAWSTAKASLLVDQSDVVELDEISDIDVQTVLDISKPEEVRDRPYLRNPVFLDIAIYLNRAGAVKFEGLKLPTETRLLDEFKAFNIKPGAGHPPADADELRWDYEKFLESLARKQLELDRFDVPLKDLKNEGHALAINHLGQGKFVIIDGMRIRLRHDLIDSHNIADLLPEEPDLLPRLLGTLGSGDKGKLHLGFGQILFEGIAQAAHDRKQPEIIEAFFLEFLRFVDNKRSLQAAGWNSGYVITARFPVFVDFIKRALAGGYLGDVKPQGIRLSDLDNLTQNAMSSVASMLGGQAPLSIEDEDGSLLRSLERHIHTIKLRGRLIEGLAKVDRPPDEVVSLLSGFATIGTFIKEDPGVIRYIARALSDVADGSSDHARLVLAALAGLRGTFAADFGNRLPTVLRVIERAERKVAKIARLPRKRETPLSIEEVIEGLQNVDPVSRIAGRGELNYSDWVLVQPYLRKLKDRSDEHESVILAVARSLWHFHKRCHEQAALTLGRINHSLARGILLHILTFETDDALESVLIDALNNQAKVLRQAAPKRAEYFRRAIIRAAACRRRLVGDQRFADLADLLGTLGDAPATLITESFIELRRFAGLPRMVEDPSASLANMPAWLTAEEEQRDVGEELEAKIAFRSRGREANGNLPFARSTWTSPRRLHEALKSRGDFFNQLARRDGRNADGPPILIAEKTGAAGEHHDRVAEYFRPKDWKDRDEPAFAHHVEAIAQRYAIFEEDQEVPSIATVHAIVLLADGYLVEAQRSSTAEYAPGTWAASFEEQMQRKDAEGGAGIRTCVRRGIEEEFGVTLAEDELEIAAVSLGIEWELINTVALVVVKLTLCSDQFSERSRDGIPDGELDRVAMTPVLQRLESLSQSELGFWIDADPRQTHPTSSARLALLEETAEVRS